MYIGGRYGHIRVRSKKEYIAYVKRRKRAIIEKIWEHKKKDSLYLKKNGFTRSEIKEYLERFPDESRQSMHSNKFPLELAYEYPNRFSSREIIKLWKLKCTPEKANKYDGRFKGTEIGDMYAVGCGPQISKKYIPQFNGLEISVAYAIGIHPKTINDQQQLKFHKLITVICNNYVSKSKQNKEDTYKLIGTGSSSIVLLNKKKEESKSKAIKFSLNIEHEYELLEKILKKNSNPKNLIVLKSPIIKNIAIELEYINGDSLENIIKSQRIPPEKILKYTNDVFNGLLEMRDAGIYFSRDLAPPNIMIDYDNNRALIIDLEIATTDPNAHIVVGRNNRYGSGTDMANDLVSLGQVVYWMYTAEHLFLEDKLASENTIRDKICNARSDAYKNQDTLQHYLEKVDNTIKDKDIAHITRSLLTAEPHDYEKIMKIINE